MNQAIRDGLPDAEEEDIVGMSDSEADIICAAIALRDKLKLVMQQL